MYRRDVFCTMYMSMDMSIYMGVGMGMGTWYIKSVYFAIYMQRDARTPRQRQSPLPSPLRPPRSTAACTARSHATPPCRPTACTLSPPSLLAARRAKSIRLWPRTRRRLAAIAGRRAALVTPAATRGLNSSARTAREGYEFCALHMRAHKPARKQPIRALSVYG